MPADREVELKFACGPDDLSAVLAAAPAGDDETRELISVYFDTPDLALHKAGASLRVREHKGRRVQTLKRGQGMIREEHEAPIETAAPDPALEPLPSMLPDGASLRPAFNVRVSRRQRTFRYRDAEIELAVDQGEVTGGEQRSPICEVELELKSGPLSALFALARELSDAAPLYLAFDSKASRGRALVAGDDAAMAHKGRRVELAAEITAGEAFQAVARGGLAQIAANAALLRAQPNAEAVHQLRVAARRLRSAFGAFRDAIGGRDGSGDEDLGRVKAELKWLGQACDAARNLDVFIEETLGSAEPGVGPSAGLSALRDAAEAARSAAWSSVSGVAASARFRKLMIDAAAWVETGDWRDSEAAQLPLKPFARQALKRRLQKVAGRGRNARDGDDAARHQLRIEAKKLHYAAEALASLFGEKHARRYLRHVKDLQAALGALNDLATAEPLIASLALPADAAFVAGELVGLKAAGKPRLIARAAKALARLEAAEPFWG